MRLRKLFYLPSDILGKVSGNTDDPIPPQGDIYIGSGDFRKQGLHQATLLQELAGLQAGSRVLDVGSGIGRTALPLTAVLLPEKGGMYEGFDVVPKGVDWCRANITSRHPHFDFRLVSLGNNLYNEIKTDAAEFVFPYEAGRFDIAFMFSVFTHLQPDVIDNYLREISRVLTPGGRCLTTMFLIDEQLPMTNAAFQFRHDFGDYRLMDEKVTDANVAISKDWLLGKIRAAGLELTAAHNGYWRTGANDGKAKDFQDVVLLHKPIA